MRYKGLVGLCLIAGLFAGCQCPIETEVVKEEIAPEVVYQERIVEKIVEVPVEKIVEVPVEKIVYQDKIVEKIVEVPVEKIVYQDKIVEKTTIESLNIKDVFFEVDSAELIPVTEQTLKSNAAILRDNPAVNLLLVGSASPEGSSDYNLKLSERRVKAVKDYLVNMEGIDHERLQTESEGAIEIDRTSWPFVRKVSFLLLD